MTDFDDLYATHYADLVVQVYAYFGDRAEAQDVVQEAFCRALVRWSRVSSYDDPVAWVRRVAWNLATSRWRRTRTALRFLGGHRGEPTVDGPGPERVALLAALATLPPVQRRAMVLRYLADRPIAEIAAREGVAEATVRSWLHRGRCALAAHLRRRPTMPDQLTALSEKDTFAAFAALRRSTVDDIRAPGVAEARRTVRRRRVATSGAASVAVLVVAGGVATLAAPRPVPPPARTADPTGAVAPFIREFPAAPADPPPDRLVSQRGPVQAGTHRFEVYCAGSGGGTVTLTAGTQSVTAPVVCGDPPVPNPAAITLVAPAERLTIALTWDPGTSLGARPDGWAVRILGA